MPKETVTEADNEKDPTLSEERITDTALRIGMICGILWGVNEEACAHLERIWKKDPQEFRYGREARLVRAARRQFMRKDRAPKR